ncbi:MAG: prepilin-type N-terminal cleavage/methylation domain-containing protein [Clostridia bacterium]|nr:prepilin-type N-terminal cleavage/methylation domain-containing protein [Clostridia bacterium]
MNIRSKKGFTLMEMLIVVAIIAILVVIAIPVFQSQLENTRKAVDDANARSVKSLAVTYAMTTENVFGTETSVKLYGVQGTDKTTMQIATAASGEGYGQTAANKGKIFAVTIDTNYNVTASGWEAVS